MRTHAAALGSPFGFEALHTGLCRLQSSRWCAWRGGSASSVGCAEPPHTHACTHERQMCAPGRCSCAHAPRSSRRAGCSLRTAPVSSACPQRRRQLHLRAARVRRSRARRTCAPQRATPRSACSRRDTRATRRHMRGDCTPRSGGERTKCVYRTKCLSRTPLPLLYASAPALPPPPPHTRRAALRGAALRPCW